jgi:hypothetical protein
MTQNNRTVVSATVGKTVLSCAVHVVQIIE